MRLTTFLAIICIASVALFWSTPTRAGSTGILQSWEPIWFFDGECSQCDRIGIMSLPYIGNTQGGRNLNAILHSCPVRWGNSKWELNAGRAVGIELQDSGGSYLRDVTMDLTSCTQHEVFEQGIVVESVLRCLRKTAAARDSSDTSSWTLTIRCPDSERKRWSAYEATYPYFLTQAMLAPEIERWSQFDSLEVFRLRLLRSQPERMPGYIAALFSNPNDDGLCPEMVDRVQVIHEFHREKWGRGNDYAYVLATARSNEMMNLHGVLFQLLRQGESWRIEHTWQFNAKGTHSRMECELDSPEKGAAEMQPDIRITAWSVERGEQTSASITVKTRDTE